MRKALLQFSISPYCCTTNTYSASLRASVLFCQLALTRLESQYEAIRSLRYLSACMPLCTSLNLLSLNPSYTVRHHLTDFKQKHGMYTSTL